MQEQKIREKQSIKYLGIFIDSNLNSKSHILELSKKKSGGIEAFWRNCVTLYLFKYCYKCTMQSFIHSLRMPFCYEETHI